jgi:hypothetical protein
MGLTVFICSIEVVLKIHQAVGGHVGRSNLTYDLFYPLIKRSVSDSRSLSLLHHIHCTIPLIPSVWILELVWATSLVAMNAFSKALELLLGLGSRSYSLSAWDYRRFYASHSTSYIAWLLRYGMHAGPCHAQTTKNPAGLHHTGARAGPGLLRRNMSGGTTQTFLKAKNPEFISRFFTMKST